MHATRRNVFSAVVAAFSFLTSLSAASAAPDQAAADKVVNEFAREMWQTLQSKELTAPEKTERLATTIEANTDTVLLGRLALGRHWRALSDEQKQRYEKVFPSFITTLLANRLISATGEVEGSFEEMFTLLDGKQAGDDAIVIRSEIMSPDSQQPVAVDWRLRERDDNLAIIDLAINQVSLLISQRSEFASVIERGSVDDLLSQLEQNAKA
jgi:phospholipid transport system substrate-binding protein